MNNDPLPTPKQRELLCDMISAAFVEIRLLCWDGQAEQAGDLADAFHNIPKEMYGWGSFRWKAFRGGLARYQRNWRSEPPMDGLDYLAMLDAIEQTQG
jgi:hypothetical protein